MDRRCFICFMRILHLHCASIQPFLSMTDLVGFACAIAIASQGKPWKTWTFLQNQIAPIFFTQTFKNRNFYGNLLEIVVPLLEVLLLYFLIAASPTKWIIEGSTISETEMVSCEFPVGQNCWHRRLNSRDLWKQPWANAVSLWRHSGCAIVTVPPSHRDLCTFRRYYSSICFNAAATPRASQKPKKKRRRRGRIQKAVVSQVREGDCQHVRWNFVRQPGRRLVKWFLV